MAFVYVALIVRLRDSANIRILTLLYVWTIFAIIVWSMEVKALYRFTPPMWATVKVNVAGDSCCPNHEQR